MAEIALSVSINAILSGTLDIIPLIIDSSGHVLMEKESFEDFKKYIQKIQPILMEMKKKNIKDASDSLKNAVRDLAGSIEKSLKLIKDCSSGSVVPLLLRYGAISKLLQNMTREIGKCLDCFISATLDLHLDAYQRVKALSEDMKRREFRAAVESEAIMKRIEDAQRECHTNHQFATHLLKEIAKLTGGEDKSDKDKPEQEEVEQHYLNQIIAFLSLSDATPRTSGVSMSEEHDDVRDCLNHLTKYREEEDEDDYLSDGEDPPLPTFLCPLSKRVMKDPVDIASGYTYERSAILQWFGSGNMKCPYSGIPLENSDVRPNSGLCDAIKEWGKMSREKKLKRAFGRLKLTAMDDIERGLSQILRFIFMLKGNAEHASVINEKELMKTLVYLLSSATKVSIKEKALECLSFLAKEKSENKMIINELGGREAAVKLLMDGNEKVTKLQSVTLLSELSTEPQLCDPIGQERNCIVHLVALVNDEDGNLAAKARQVLHSLCISEGNAIQMAHANYFQPLAGMIISGPHEMKIQMVSSLRKAKLTNYGNANLAKEGIMASLVQMLSDYDGKATSDALELLRGISTISEAAERLLKASIIEPTFEILMGPKKEHQEVAANILANLASSDKTYVKHEILKERRAIPTLLQFIVEDEPTIKAHVLKLLLALVFTEPSVELRDALWKEGAVRALLFLFVQSDPPVRLDVLKLLHSLARENGQLFATHLSAKHMETFVSTMEKGSYEEKAEASGILGSLPTNDPGIRQVLESSQALQVIMDELERCAGSIKTDEVAENALKALLHFTSPPSLAFANMPTGQDVIHLLVKTLSLPSGSALSKKRAAMALAELSESAQQTHVQVTKRSTMEKLWSFILCEWGASMEDTNCPVHRRDCSRKGSFCLVKERAIEPLVKALGIKECGADEAVIRALDTLVLVGEGARVIDEEKGWEAMMLVLANGSEGAKREVLPLVEKISCLRPYNQHIGPPARNHLIQIMQQPGASNSKKIAAKILGNLGEIPLQSSYF